MCCWDQYQTGIATRDAHTSYKYLMQVTKLAYRSEHTEKPLKSNLFGLTEQRLGWVSAILGVVS